MTCRAASQSCSQSNVLGTLGSCLNGWPLPAFGILWGKRSRSQESLGQCCSHDPVCPCRSVRPRETCVTLKSQWHFRMMGLHMRFDGWPRLAYELLNKSSLNGWIFKHNRNAPDRFHFFRMWVSVLGAQSELSSKTGSVVLEESPLRSMLNFPQGVIKWRFCDDPAGWSFCQVRNNRKGWHHVHFLVFP